MSVGSVKGRCSWRRVSALQQKGGRKNANILGTGRKSALPEVALEHKSWLLLTL